jgi:predicted acetyltransferase
MDGLDDMAVELGEPCLGLTASEGPIYERFGYGVATRTRVIEIDRRRAQIDPRWSPEPVRLVEAADHVDQLRDIYDRYRAAQPGEVSRSEPLFREQTIEKDKANFAAIHPDGYAVWSVENDWQYGHPNHSVFIRDLIAVTPEAHLALWNLLLSIDLVGPIRSIRAASVDDPLPQFLTDPRALRTIELNDGVWLKVLDPLRCFGARSYRTDDRLVIEVRDDPDSPRIGIGNSGCGPTDDRPDLVADRSALGPLLLGTNPSRLAVGRRVEADPATLIRADLLFGIGRDAHNRTGF